MACILPWVAAAQRSVLYRAHPLAVGEGGDADDTAITAVPIGPLGIHHVHLEVRVLARTGGGVAFKWQTAMLLDPLVHVVVFRIGRSRNLVQHGEHLAVVRAIARHD